MSTSAERMMCVTGRVSLEQAHDALMSEKVRDELYGAQDDIGDWAHTHFSTLRAGLADRRLAELAEQEKSNRVLRESCEHFVRACRGTSCRQGRLPCRENCPPAAEMACTSGDEPGELSLFTPQGKLTLAAIAAVLVLICWLDPLSRIPS